MILEKLQTVEKTINSELSSKIQNSRITHDELLIETDENSTLVSMMKLRCW